MRVLFASANYGERIVGGAQVSMRFVAQELVRMGHDVGVAFIDPEGIPRETTADGIRLFRLPHGNLYWHLRPRQHSLKRFFWHVTDRYGKRLVDPAGDVLTEFKPDVVHTNVLGGLSAAIWHAAAAKNIPIVHSVHDYYLLCANSGMRRRGENCDFPCGRCKVFTLPSRQAAKLVSSVVYVSSHMKRAHEKQTVFHPDACATQIIGACDMNDAPTVRTGFAWPLRLGYLGRIAPDKGIEGLLDSLRYLDGHRYSLDIGGTGAPAYLESLQRRAQDQPARFLGRVEPHNFYSSIDALIVPSLWNEPAARVVYEAGLSGVPVIVAKRGGLPELVGHGKRGWIYEPDDPAALGRVLKQIVDRPMSVSKKVGAWSAVAEEFSPLHVTRRTLDAYREAMAKCGLLSPAEKHAAA